MHVRNLLAAAALATSFSHAALIDNRSAPGASVVEAAYRSVSVEDMVAGLVPSAYAVTYEAGASRLIKTSVAGKGSWDTLLTEGLKTAGLTSKIDTQARSVVISVVPGATPAALAAGKFIAPEAKKQPALPSAYVVRAQDGSVWRTVQRWASDANMQLVWEPEEVDYPVKGETQLGTDIRTALTGLFAALQSTPTPLRACIHNNQPRALIRVIRAGDSCRLEGAL